MVTVETIVTSDYAVVIVRSALILIGGLSALLYGLATIQGLMGLLEAFPDDYPYVDLVYKKLGYEYYRVFPDGDQRMRSPTADQQLNLTESLMVGAAAAVIGVIADILLILSAAGWTLYRGYLLGMPTNFRDVALTAIAIAIVVALSGFFRACPKNIHYQRRNTVSNRINISIIITSWNMMLYTVFTHDV